MSLWDEVRSNLSQWTSAAADRGETMARVGMRQMDRYGIQRRLSRQFAELGGELHALIARGEAGAVADIPSIQTILRRIDLLEAELRSAESEIASLRERKRSGGTPGESTGPDPASHGASEP